MSEFRWSSPRGVALALAVAAAWTVVPFWAPLLLAAWAADLLQPAVRRLERVLGPRRRAAAAVVVLLLVAVLVPLTGVVAAIVVGAADLLAQLRAALEGRGTLAGALLGADGGAPLGAREWTELAARHGANAWRALVAVARTSASAVIEAVVFVVTLYALVARGASAYRWIVRNAPFSPRVVGRLARAFRETGRSLIVAGGGTALVQGLVATAAYVVIGIPRALLLGPLTAVCAIVPVVGTAIVWAPLAIELAASGAYGRAVAVTAAGAVIGVVDNFVRPVLARFGRLRLPVAVVLVAMLGGLATFGPAGALLGPLLVRLAAEALAMAREEPRAA